MTTKVNLKLARIFYKDKATGKTGELPQLELGTAKAWIEFANTVVPTREH